MRCEIGHGSLVDGARRRRGRLTGRRPLPIVDAADRSIEHHSSPDRWIARRVRSGGDHGSHIQALTHRLRRVVGRGPRHRWDPASLNGSHLGRNDASCSCSGVPYEDWDPASDSRVPSADGTIHGRMSAIQRRSLSARPRPSTARWIVMLSTALLLPGAGRHNMVLRAGTCSRSNARARIEDCTPTTGHLFTPTE